MSAKLVWAFFPRCDPAPRFSTSVVKVFRDHHDRIRTTHGVKGALKSNQVLAVLSDALRTLDFKVETGKKKPQKLEIPVLFGRNGEHEKQYEADAYHPVEKCVLEIEAGGAHVGAVYKDIIQASQMPEVDYLSIAVPVYYTHGEERLRTDEVFEAVYRVLDTIYTSRRLVLPLKGILLIGY